MADKRYAWAQAKGFNQDGELEAVASTADLDRDEERIEVEAWRRDLGRYQANPVILAGHQHRLAGGNSPVVGSARTVELRPDALLLRIRFAGTELGREYEQLYREGHMRAFSVGFIPINGEWRDVQEAAAADDRRGAESAEDIQAHRSRPVAIEKKPSTKRIYVHTRVELLEVSCVPVPSNPAALARMLAEEREAAGRIDAAALAAQVGQIAGKAVAEAVQGVLTGLAAELRGMFDELIVLHDAEGPGRSLPPDRDEADGAAEDQRAERMRAAAEALRGGRNDTGKIV